MKLFKYQLRFVVLLILIPLANNVSAAKGCTIHAVDGTTKHRLKLVSFPGNSNFAQHFLRQILEIQKILGISDSDMPLVGIYDDNDGKNAVAISNIWMPTTDAFWANYSRPNETKRNTILFGENMLWELAYPTTGDNLNTAEIFAVLAHEFAHHTQYLLEQNPKSEIEEEIVRNLRSARTPQIELMADAISGWVFGITEVRGNAKRSKKTLLRTLERMYNLGDYDFNSPNHHGTPKERVSAFSFGYDLATNTTKTPYLVFRATFNRYVGWDENNR